MSENGNGHGAKRRVFTLGDMVRIKTGAFSSFTGKIEGINQSKMLLKVRVTIFGRTTPVKLHFTDVDKVTFTED
jgi:transcriptional antiterminator NusG